MQYLNLSSSNSAGIKIFIFLAFMLTLGVVSLILFPLIMLIFLCFICLFILLTIDLITSTVVHAIIFLTISLEIKIVMAENISSIPLR